MLGLRLDVPLALNGLEAGVDAGQVERLGRIGLVERGPDGLRLTRRGRMIANDVTASLIA
jgi:coproporphyrinogen III oxidase-like Fe-S oxidoreductase